MWARKRIDIGWGDLGFAALQCFRSGRSEVTALPIDPTQDSYIFECLSVRTGFDLLLSDCAFPEGSEVLMSALNIEDMFRIIEAHGLVPVPLDIDRERLLPTTEAVREAITANTRLVVIAHLFGAHSDLSEINQVCANHGLDLVEDYSQSFDGSFQLPQGACLAYLYSFGSIKTATSLGGAVLTLRDAERTCRMRAIERGYPILSRRWYLRRVAKYACLKALCYKIPYGIFMRLLGRHHDQVVSRIARGFGNAMDLSRIRKRSPTAMLALLARRVRKFDAQAMERQRRRGAQLKGQLQPHHRIPGASAQSHQYTFFPVLAQKPMQLKAQLAAAGFDSAMHGSLVVSGESEPLEKPVKVARQLLEQMVFLPFYEEMPDGEFARMTALIGQLNERIPNQGGST